MDKRAPGWALIEDKKQEITAVDVIRGSNSGIPHAKAPDVHSVVDGCTTAQVIPSPGRQRPPNADERQAISSKLVCASLVWGGYGTHSN